MTWTGYWTPIRYILLVKIASLFDEDLAKRAWKARIDINDETAMEELVYVCRALLPRLSALPDARSRQLIGDSLRWAIKNPGELHYNCKSSKEVLTVTPNLIGFQAVLHSIASRLKSPKAFSCITVDQQSQFNKAQRSLAELYASARFPWATGPGLPKMDLSKIPTTPIVFRSSKNSVGLELVDTYLWIFKRVFEKREIATELYPIIASQMRRGKTDEVSIRSISARWSHWLKNFPQLSEENLQAAKEILQTEEEKRLRAVKSG